MKKMVLVACAILLTSGYVQISRAQQLMKGRVIDLESTSVPPKGIDGVRIEVKDTAGSTIKTGVTDGSGGYEFPIPSGSKLPLAAEFRKFEYFEDPSQLKVEYLEKPQPDVVMANAKRDDAYYKRVAENVIGQKNESTRRAHLGVIAALPAGDQEKVVANLSPKEHQKLLSQLDNVKATRSQLTNVQQFLVKEGFLGIAAQPKFQTEGSQIWFYGSVPSSAEANRLKDLTKSTFPAARVEYNVQVAPHIAIKDYVKDGPSK